jgi:ubiquinone/menaquinone biosynthesis C-methylase UbiE
MIEQAESSSLKEEYPKLTFRKGSGESLPFVTEGSVDLVVAAQAAHWFDYQKLWPEMNRVVRKGGTLAFWGYKDRSDLEEAAWTGLTFPTSCFRRLSESYRYS